MIAFLLIFGVSFYAVGTSLVRLVGDSLFQTRTNAEIATVENLAVRFAPLLSAKDTQSLYEQAIESGRELGGRILILDADGKVQVDTFSRLNGIRLTLPEVISVLNGASTDSGMHTYLETTINGRSAIFDFLRFRQTGISWVGYFSAAIESQGQRLGLVLLSVSMQDVVDNLRVMSDQIVLCFLIGAVAVLLMTLFFISIIMRPIGIMTEGIRQMGRGVLSTRVPVKGRDEFARMAETFNQMSEKLEHLDTSRNEFVSNASHELKTPLASMKIMVETMMLQEDMDPQVRSEFLGDIDKEIDRLSHIVTDLLTLVRGDSREVKIPFKRTKLKDITDEAVSRLMTIAEERNQQLVFIADSDCVVMGDPGRLHQAVYNLVENAIKYTPEGGKVSVTLEQAGKYAVLKVSDNGVGIPKKDQAHIFDRFYRVDKARSRATGGNGLGLSIVQQTVLMHNGDISVQSEEGKGSTFIVQIPLVQ